VREKNEKDKSLWLNTIPIVMGNPGDPIQSGFVASLPILQNAKAVLTQLVATFPG
jgi:hypothetical protein